VKKAQQQALDRLIRDAWNCYAQHAHMQWPAGTGGHIALNSAHRVMAEAAFKRAVNDIVGALIKETT